MPTALQTLNLFEVKLKNYASKLEECKKELEYTKKRLAFAQRKKPEDPAAAKPAVAAAAPKQCAGMNKTDCKNSSSCVWVESKKKKPYCRKRAQY